jgi:hypothetical protein
LFVPFSLFCSTLCADQDDSMSSCQHQPAVPPDSLAIEPSNSDITASTITYDAISMSTTPVAYRGSIVDMGSELQVKKFIFYIIFDLVLCLKNSDFGWSESSTFVSSAEKKIVVLKP